LLSAHVHFVPAGEQSSVSWSFATDSDFSDRSMCFRITEDAQGKHSDWLWSQPIPVEKSRGEFPAKMYRPKTHDQYIARVVTHRLEGGSLLLQLYPEDKDHPPYRIRNLCLTRAVAFRQLGASKSNPWLLRPGMSTRYSWDNILAPKRKQVLVLEVIETIMVSDGDVDRVEEIISPEIELRIDIVSSYRLDKYMRTPAPFIVRIDLQGPTKIVTFFENEKLFESIGPSQTPRPTLEDYQVPMIDWEEVMVGGKPALTDGLVSDDGKVHSSGNQDLLTAGNADSSVSPSRSGEEPELGRRRT